jgi:hypothetical protein
VQLRIDHRVRQRADEAALALGFFPPAAIHAFNYCSNTGSGTAPSANMVSLHQRWSNFAPSVAPASRRMKSALADGGEFGVSAN